MKSNWEQHILIKSLTRQKKVKINERVISDLRSDYFTIPLYKKTFKRIDSYYKKTGRILTWKEIIADPSLSDSLKTKLKAKEVKRSKLRKYDKSVILPSSFKEYSMIISNVVNNSKYAELANLSNNLSNSLNNKDLTIDQIDKILFDTDTKVNRIKSFNTGTNGTLFHLTKANVKHNLDTFHHKMENKFFLPTGFNEFDNQNIGIPRDSFFVISGKSGSGKSSLSVQLALNWKKEGLRVCFIPLEMSIEQMLFRVAANLLNISIVELVKNYKKYRKKILKVIGKFVNSNDGSCLDFYVPDVDETYIDTLQILLPMKYDALIDDYINLNAPVDNDETKNLTLISRYSKVYSTNHGVCTVALAQLDKDKEQIRYSRAVEESASNCWVWPETKDDVAELGHITVKQLKARNQNPFTFKLNANLATCSFSNYMERSIDDYKSNGSDLEKDTPDEDDV